MGFYADHVFPHLMDWTLGTRRFQELREQALASAQGHVLEIGFGTGLNLQMRYVTHGALFVRMLTTLTPEPRPPFCHACFSGQYPIAVPKDVQVTKFALEETAAGHPPAATVSWR